MEFLTLLYKDVLSTLSCLFLPVYYVCWNKMEKLYICLFFFSVSVHSGEGMVFTLDELTGALVVSHRLVVSSRDFPGEFLYWLIFSAFSIDVTELSILETVHNCLCFWAHLCHCTVGSYASLSVCPDVMSEKIRLVKNSYLRKHQS